MLPALFQQISLNFMTMFILFQLYFHYKERITSKLLRQIIIGTGFGIIQYICLRFPLTLPDSSMPIFIGSNIFILAAVYGGPVGMFIALVIGQIIMKPGRPSQVPAANDPNMIMPSGGPVEISSFQPIGGMLANPDLFIILFGIVAVLAYRFLPLKNWQVWLCLNILFQIKLYWMLGDTLTTSLIRCSVEIISGALIYYYVDYMHRAYQSKKQLEQLATKDSLTGVYNAGYYAMASERLFAEAKRGKSNLALLIMDIDHFKHINDTYGHPVGDQVLKEMAGLLKHAFPGRHEIVCRNGGEEFSVLIPHRDATEVTRTAEHFQENVRSHVFAADREDLSLRLTVSVGICFYSEDCTRHQDMYERADRALYQAKHNGRDQICYADSHLAISS
ncbi:GGDEF domain-containing protein [Paenibacillus sambharensis]|uniref:GGDEF domain-containing protein n=1 Tax=Paenibacillus sambharensis TaxID=1803190 RepID=A0A2W1LSF3_9BACL|nr:GGDEF domain-containing protein [Paenibacillus sambharensis]PZD97424.1 GGDEF domain-containing protein [Paenibacillus sambharensis]